MRDREVIDRLHSIGDPARLDGMARYAIVTEHAYGVSIPQLRALAKEIGTDHLLAASLWDSGIHEARILASMIADPALVTEAQMDRWVAGFDSWDLCDQVCANLLRHTQFAYAKAAEWSGRRQEFIKRAGFALIAGLAVAGTRTSQRGSLAPHLLRRKLSRRRPSCATTPCSPTATRTLPKPTPHRQRQTG